MSNNEQMLKNFQRLSNLSEGKKSPHKETGVVKKLMNETIKKVGNKYFAIVKHNNKYIVSESAINKDKKELVSSDFYNLSLKESYLNEFKTYDKAAQRLREKVKHAMNIKEEETVEDEEMEMDSEVEGSEMGDMEGGEGEVDLGGDSAEGGEGGMEGSTETPEGEEISLQELAGKLPTILSTVEAEDEEKISAINQMFSALWDFVCTDETMCDSFKSHVETKMAEQGEEGSEMGGEQEGGDVDTGLEGGEEGEIDLGSEDSEGEGSEMEGGEGDINLDKNESAIKSKLKSRLKEQTYKLIEQERIKNPKVKAMLEALKKKKGLIK
jgi:hypothetical protein